MQKETKNYAFIDGQNLYLAIENLGWKLDYKKFRIYLKEKYNIEKVYMFMGFLDENRDLYKFLKKTGYTLIFKPILVYKDGQVKGNCDAELVLQAMIDYKNYDKAVIVTGDGDFYCLINYFIKTGKLKTVLIPNQNRYSALLKRINKSNKKFFSFISNLRKKLEYTAVHKRKGPHKDRTL